MGEQLGVGPQEGGARRDRSPSFPFIGLQRAIERTRQLFALARRYEIRMADAAPAWNLKPASSAVIQTVAAMLAYGLIEDAGSGKDRKIKVSELGRRILEDERPGAREAALAEAALKPKAIAELFAHWGEGRPADSICMSELKLDRNFTEEGAKKFLAVYDDAIQFALPKNADKLPPEPLEKVVKGGDTKREKEDINPWPRVQVGDYVQWTSAGVDQFVKPRPVSWISEDGSHLRVVGSMTGIPAREVVITEAPKLNVKMKERVAGSDDDINVLLTNAGRLQITADVDAEGLAKLRQMLAKYEEILSLLATPTDQVWRPKAGESEPEE